MRNTLFALSLVASLGLFACGNRQPDRGPMEQAGHDVDHAAQRAEHDVNEAVDEAGEAIDESTDHDHH
jgi:hypothetical protein